MSETESAGWKKTACTLCAVNCGLEVQTEGRRIVRIRGDKAHPISQGYVCEKSQRLDYYQNGADRLDSPLRRRPDGTYERIDWPTAIREIAQKLTAIRAEHGGESIFYYGGGSQGNHLGATYADSTLKALGVKFRSNALAQEKTGEAWVQGKMMGSGIHGDFEHCEVAVFVGKNPWQSHGFARARVILREIQNDPARSLIVIDPRRSETAAMADFHLAVRPGTDAWCLAALAAILVQDGLVAQAWVDEHTTGYPQVAEALRRISVAAYAGVCGVEEALLRRVAERIARAKSVSMIEDLGVQMNLHSTLNSYLNRLVWLLTGHYARPGTNNAFVPLLGLSQSSKDKPSAESNARSTGGAAPPRPGSRSPVTGSRIIMGLMPCNVIPEEILTDHPKRFRAMLIESANPVHSLADSQRMREAMRALELSVVIDVAMTETAREADYVLPASSQFEKAEATFFNLEFPRNGFHLRQPLFEPRAGTLTEAEIHARLVEALGELDDRHYRFLRRAAQLGSTAFALASRGRRSATSGWPATHRWCCTERWGRTCPREWHPRRRFGASARCTSGGTPRPRAAQALAGPASTPATSCSKPSLPLAPALCSRSASTPTVGKRFACPNSASTSTFRNSCRNSRSSTRWSAEGPVLPVHSFRRRAAERHQQHGDSRSRLASERPVRHPAHQSTGRRRPRLRRPRRPGSRNDAAWQRRGAD